MAAVSRTISAARLAAALLTAPLAFQTAGAQQQQQASGPLQAGLQLSAAGKHDTAIVLLESVVAKRLPGGGRALQELVGLYAATNRLDDAHRVLTLARSNGVDYSAIASRPDIAPLRADARFSLLFPDRNAFGNPFVEKTRIIHEWHGEAAGDEFGWIARAVGDVDRDSIADIVVSATMNPPAGSGKGKLYVYSGRSGALLWKRIGDEGWRLGTSVEAAGDVNGDGIPDVIAGAPGARLAIVLSGSDGREIHRIEGDSADVNFGGAVAGIGDIDRDGAADVVAGASMSSARKGRAFVYSGKRATRLLVLEGENDGAMFGSAVAGGGGRFIAVGAPGAGAAGRGRVYIYDGLSRTPRFTHDADSTGAALGAMFVAMAGDVDGDGLSDVFASDYSNRARGPATGRVYVYSTATPRTLLTITGDTSGDTFGTSASYAGDVNGDGVADLAVGSWQFGGAAWSGGKVSVHSGRDGSVLQRFTGRIPGETLGFDAVGVGDIDGDGATDFLVTSAYSMVNGGRSGRVYIVAGRKHGS